MAVAVADAIGAFVARARGEGDPAATLEHPVRTSSAAAVIPTDDQRRHVVISGPPPDEDASQRHLRTLPAIRAGGYPRIRGRPGYFFVVLAHRKLEEMQGV